jgi:hypothetical protein
MWLDLKAIKVQLVNGCLVPGTGGQDAISVLMLKAFAAKNPSYFSIERTVGKEPVPVPLGRLLSGPAEYASKVNYIISKAPSLDELYSLPRIFKAAFYVDKSTGKRGAGTTVMVVPEDQSMHCKHIKLNGRD